MNPLVQQMQQALRRSRVRAALDADGQRLFDEIVEGLASDLYKTDDERISQYERLSGERWPPGESV